jgi:hypothetical protein
VLHIAHERLSAAEYRAARQIAAISVRGSDLLSLGAPTAPKPQAALRPLLGTIRHLKGCLLRSEEPACVGIPACAVPSRGIQVSASITAAEGRSSGDKRRQLALVLKGWIGERPTSSGAVGLVVGSHEVFVDVGQEGLVEEVNQGLGAD